MEIGTKFKDLSSYCQNMTASMEDKLFFVDMLPDYDSISKQRKLIVDFGCADGTMTRMLSSIFSNDADVIGYDISTSMINLAKSKCDYGQERNIIFTEHWDDVKAELNDKKKHCKVLILSSVIHEVYSYASKENSVSDFWDKVKNSGFDYVVIRDMSLNETMANTIPSYFTMDSLYALLDTKYGDQLKDFEKIWGSIRKSKKNLYHFLLKYMWTINWDREVRENYFPLSTEELMSIMGQKYNLVYFSHFNIPFLVNKIENDINQLIKINDPTHIKCIYKIKEIK